PAPAPAPPAPDGGAAQPVVWTNLVNVTANGNSVTKTSGCDGCNDAGAISQQKITAGDGYAQFAAGATGPLRMAGLTQSFTVSSPSTIAFAIRFQSNIAEVREGGVYRADTRFVAGDTFRVSIQSGVVRYSKNGTVFYTSQAAPAYPLVLAAALAHRNGVVADAVIGGGASGAPAASPPGPSAGPSPAPARVPGRHRRGPRRRRLPQGRHVRGGRRLPYRGAGGRGDLFQERHGLLHERQPGVQLVDGLRRRHRQPQRRDRQRRRGQRPLGRRRRTLRLGVERPALGRRPARRGALGAPGKEHALDSLTQAQRGALDQI